MSDLPFLYHLPAPGSFPEGADNHYERRLSSMRGYYYDPLAYEEALAAGDALVYEVFEWARPQAAGELPSGISYIHPGKVGDEFFMTKGHFHEVVECAEVYICLSGEGYMVMEDPEGASEVRRLQPGSVLYVPPRWAHRSVCTGRTAPLVIWFTYPGHAGHNYASIAENGFLKVVLDRPEGPLVSDHPRLQQRPA